MDAAVTIPLAVMVVGGGFACIQAYFTNRVNKEIQLQGQKMQDQQNLRMSALESGKLEIQVNEEQQKAHRDTIEQLYKLIDLNKEEAALHGEKAEAAKRRVVELETELERVYSRMSALEEEVARLKHKLQEQGIEVE